ncbi:MAG: EamA family transporter, partial [Candidatus Nanopelagicaceae bacterium]
MKQRLASWLLLLIAMSWGLAFVTMKDALGRQSVNSFLFYRFALATIALLIVHPQILKKLDKDIIK